MAGAALVPLYAAMGQGLRDPAAEAEWFYRDRWRCWLLLGGLVAPGVYNGAMPANEHNVYIGLLPLALAVFGLRRERFFAALAGIALALATCWPIPRWIAPVSFSLPTRYLFLFTLGACVCFARALDRIPPRAWLKAAVAALILADLRLDTAAVAAGLLHDVLEDTKTTAAKIAELFSPEIARLVDGVTKLTRLDATGHPARHR